MHRDMVRKEYLFLAISGLLIVGLMSGYFFAAKVDNSQVVKISGFNYEVSHVGVTYKVVFQGDVVNPGLGIVKDVKILIHWKEMDNIKHVGSLYIGDIPGQGSEKFSITFECEYMLLIKSASPTLEWS